MLKLRISPVITSYLDDRSPEAQLRLAHIAKEHIEKSTVWLYEHDRQLKALSNNELTFILEKSHESADWDYDVVKIRSTTSDDRFRMLTGKQVYDLTVLPATHTTSRNITVDRVFVVILNYDDYERMSQHDRYLVSAAWKRAHRGRQYEMIKLGAYTLYQMTAISTDASTSSDTAELDTTLRDYGIGRVSNDPFELRLLGKMLDEKRRAP